MKDIKIQLTQKETEMINSVATNEYAESNGSFPDNADETMGYYYTECLTTKSIDENQVRGVITSLNKKGLLEVQVNDGDDNFIWLTDKGYEIFVILTERGQI